MFRARVLCSRADHSDSPGVVLFTLFAVLAGYSGYLEWKMFMWTDSFRYPALTYGDLAYRM